MTNQMFVQPVHEHQAIVILDGEVLSGDGEVPPPAIEQLAYRGKHGGRSMGFPGEFGGLLIEHRCLPLQDLVRLFGELKTTHLDDFLSMSFLTGVAMMYPGFTASFGR